MEDFKNELLKRREVKVLVNAESNLGYENAIKIIVEQFKAKEEMIVLKALKSKFGMNTFLISAYIYNSEKDKERIEPRKKENKKTEEVKK